MKINGKTETKKQPEQQQGGVNNGAVRKELSGRSQTCQCVPAPKAGEKALRIFVKALAPSRFGFDTGANPVCGLHRP